MRTDRLVPRSPGAALGAAVALVAAAALAACNAGSSAWSGGWQSGADGGGGGDTIPSSDQGAGCGGKPTLAAIQDAVFSKSCAFGSCHGPSNPAAGLDLTAGHACASLVGHASCVFSGRTLVVPGHPEESYLAHVLAGDDLGTSPDGTCADLANGSPQRMPLGGEPLCQGQIDQVKAWIAAGAPCSGASGDAGAGGGDGGGGGSDGGTSGDAGAGEGSQGDAASGDATAGGDASDGGAGSDAAAVPADVARVTSTMTAFAAGQSVGGAVLLAQPAPAPGVSVTLTASDPTVLAAPSLVFVAAGQSSAPFQMMGLRPGHASLQASAGGKTAGVDELVQGLNLAEVFYLGPTTSAGLQWVRLYNGTSNPIDLADYSLGAGTGSYLETKLQLAGVIAPGGCFVVGGPTSSVVNGSPTFSLAAAFSPIVPAAGSGGAGVALFGAPAAGVDASTLPVDSVVYGVTNAGNLLAPDGTVAPAVIGGDVLPGDSLMSFFGSWSDQYPPSPDSCP